MVQVNIDWSPVKNRTQFGKNSVVLGHFWLKTIFLGFKKKNSKKIIIQNLFFKKMKTEISIVLKGIIWGLRD